MSLVPLVAACLGALLAACASSGAPAPPAVAPEPTPEPTASQVAWLPPPPAASSAPSVASASARASSSAAASVAPPAPACAGAELELRAVILDRACAWQGDAPKLPVGIVARVEPERPTVTASGTILLSVIIENTTEQPAVFAVETSWGGLGLGLGPGMGGETIANAETPGVLTRTEDLLGNELDEPKLKTRFAMLGVITKPALARVELAPHGVLKARVRWRPQGYLPGKDYDAKVRVHEGILDIPPPDPLPKGRYRVRVVLPIAGLSARSVDVTVTGR